MVGIQVACYCVPTRETFEFDLDLILDINSVVTLIAYRSNFKFSIKLKGISNNLKLA